MQPNLSIAFIPHNVEANGNVVSSLFCAISTFLKY